LLSHDYEKLLLTKKLEDNVLAFRKSQPNKKVCNIDHSLNAFNDIIKQQRCVVLAFDVSSFFDILDHRILKDKWLEVINQSTKTKQLPSDHYKVFKSITSYSSVDRDEVYDTFKISSNSPKKVSYSVRQEIKYKSLSPLKRPVTKNNRRIRICTNESFRKLVSPKIKKNKEQKGIPQGSPMSGLLSNLYMIDFDVKLKKFTEDHGGKYYRYCDDLLCILPIAERDEIFPLANELEQYVYGLADDFKLDVNAKKTEKYAFMPKNEINARFTHDKKPKPFSSSQISCAQIQDKHLIFSRVQYLGFKFDGAKITLRSSSISRYQKKLKRGIKYHLKLKNKYDKNGKLKTKKLRTLYSHAGDSNFLSYAYRAAKGMKQPAIRSQLKNHQKVIGHQIDCISKRINIPK